MKRYQIKKPPAIKLRTGWIGTAYDFSGAINLRVKEVAPRFDCWNDLKKYNAFFVGYKRVLIFYNSVFVGYNRVFVGYNSVFVFYNCVFVFYKRVLIFYNSGRIFNQRVFVGYNSVFVFYNPARIFDLRVSFEVLLPEINWSSYRVFVKVLT